MTVSLSGARRTMLGALATAVVLALAGPAPASAASNTLDSAPPTDKIVVEVITVNGSGCRPGTAAVAVAPDNTAFTVTYSEYLASVGVGANPTDFRKNCQLNLRFHVPQGFTYAIAKADYRGFAHLQRGAWARQGANYYFQGDSATARLGHNFYGPFSNDWQATDVTDVTQLVWAPCGVFRNLNVNTDLRVYAGSSNPNTTTSFITMDSTDGSIKTIYHFAWKRC
jgi:Domain of unknown function (DUF4360)